VGFIGFTENAYPWQLKIFKPHYYTNDCLNFFLLKNWSSDQKLAMWLQFLSYIQFWCHNLPCPWLLVLPHCSCVL